MTADNNRSNVSMIVYHLTTRAEWQAALEAGAYTSPTLDSAGFIHASTVEQVIPVANAFYRGQKDLILLVIDTDLLQSDLRWESPAHIAETDDPPEEGLFPHIYGPIALDCVVEVLDLPANADGVFDLPASLR
jgi:uncharacterized protein (DUF952 family)